MFKHLFKLIWNKRKQNFLLITEILVSFLVLFAVFTLLIYNYKNYSKPLGFEYKDVWTVTYSNSYKTTNNDSLTVFYEALRQSIQSMPQVKKVSFSSDNVPFFQNRATTQLTYNKKQINNVSWYRVDDNYREALGLKVTAGRWFDKQDAVANDKPVVINEEIRDEVFGKAEAIGKIFGDEDGKSTLKVIGVVQNVKAQGDYTEAGKAYYSRLDTAAFQWMGKLIILVTPDADAAFESRLYKTFANYMKNSNVEIEHLSNKRISINYFSLVPMIVMLIVAGFLMINVALGLFGVLWYNINKRRGEIGLRRAIGASGRTVSAQLVSESFILATLSLVIGFFFAVQFPLLKVFDLPTGVYLTALLFAVLFIYGLVFICSLYPGRQAAGIYPAVALHEE